MRVLVAEDDPLIREGLAEIVRAEGHEALEARDGREALELFDREGPDFVCLDIMMPGLSGYDVCRAIRARGSGVPVVFVSAKSEEIDRVLGLELGADDYIVKPFGVREVAARIRAVSRRCLGPREDPAEPEPFLMDDLEVRPAELRARRGDEVIDLTPREVAILVLLWERRGRPVDRDTFFDRCWGYDHVPNSRTLDQHVAQLRKRIERDPRDPRIIRTVWGVGYRFEE